MGRTTLSVDAAIIGAGIGGLWLANLLAARGLSVVVCDGEPVGGVQTIASQGIIHGGVKYALEDRDARLTEVLGGMPGRWRACLEGRGEVDLRGVRILAEHLRLYADQGSVEKLPAGTGRPRTIRAGEVHPFGAGTLLELDDLVVDVPSLVRALAERIRDRFVAEAVPPASVIPAEGGIDRIELAGATIRAGIHVLAAGAGNGALARRAGFDVPARRRPLHQALVRVAEPASVFAHCILDGHGTAPAMTVTSHGTVLSVGGRVADEGVGRTQDEQVRRVRSLFAQALPGVDLGHAGFNTFTAIRAEPAAPASPDQGRSHIRDIENAFVMRKGNCLLCWPVKLSLAPRLGDLVVESLGDLVPVHNAWSGNPGARLRYASAPASAESC